MNRIILIGNGFDLAHGLKTSYKDFINNFWGKQVNKILSSVFNGNELITNSYEDNVVKAYATNSDWKMIKNISDPKYKGYNLFQTFCHMPVTFIGDDETYNTEYYSINDSYLDTYINVSRNFNDKNLLRKNVLPRHKCVSLTPLNK